MKTTDTPESDAAWDYAWDEGGCHEGHLLDTMLDPTKRVPTDAVALVKPADNQTPDANGNS